MTNPLSLHAFVQSKDPKRVSSVAGRLSGSEILKIAGEIRQMVAEGKEVCNLTVGDFDPKLYPIPVALKDAIVKAYEDQHTNYPPSNGMPELRKAVAQFYKDQLGLDYPLDSFLIASGARPAIYGIYRSVVDPGDVVVYPTPSWNNNHYVNMLGAETRVVVCKKEDGFMPTKELLKDALKGARLLCINSPLNPTGTAIGKTALKEICEAVLEENKNRGPNERPLYLMYDHIYWMLSLDEHLTPPGLMPEMAAYTLFVDGISKAFAATGVRVGWAVGPVDVMERMSAILGHVGAWAPKPEQVATATFLSSMDAMKSYTKDLLGKVSGSLDALHKGFESMKAKGMAVDSLKPQGAIYLTVQIAPFGKKTPEGKTLNSNEDIRRYLLEAAGFGIVPFQAFGYQGESGWFRLSVGAVGLGQIQSGLLRVQHALEVLT